MNAKANRRPWVVRVGRAHIRLIFCVALGLLVMLAVPATPVTRILIGWDAGVLAYLAAAASVMARCDSVAQMRRNAAAQDEGAFAMLFLTVAAALASLGAIFAELALIERDNPHYGLYGVLAIATVALSWAFIHTIFALHYAHEFYGAGERKNGLRFPEDNQPDYWDFIYFSFVIGMTFQVSDVAVTHKSVRRTVVAHGALSFLFVTAILAMTVNVAANIIQK
jgi:uncharacterized membrane protein